MTKAEIESALAGMTWLEPWVGVNEGSSASALEQALQRELISGHELFGRAARAIGRREDRDDVLFLVADSWQLAVVHLTYSKAKSAESPHVMLFDSLQEFEAGCMQPDHDEHTDADEDE